MASYRTFPPVGPKLVSKASIARTMDVSPTTLHHFVKTQKLQT